jgi:hypothetical protein
MKKVKLMVVVAMVFSLVVGCAPILNSAWKTASEEEKVRLTLKDAQDQLNFWLDVGYGYVKLHPEKDPIWKGQVLPLAKTINGMIGEMIRESKTTQGKITVGGALNRLYPKIVEMENILISWGLQTKKKGG